MQSNLPKIKTKYIFTLIDSINNEIKQQVETHNDMCENFWYVYSYYAGDDYELCLGADDDITKGFIWAAEDDASQRSYPKKNTVKIVFVFPASTSVVGEVKSFGIFHSCMASSQPPFGRSISAVNTKGTLKDSEGNPITITKTALDKLIVEVEWEFQFASNDFVFFEDLQSEIVMNAAMLGYNSGYASKYAPLNKALQNALYVSTLPFDKGIIPIGHIAYSTGSSGSSMPCFWGSTYSPNWQKTGNDPYKYTENNTVRIPQADLPLHYINQIGILGLGSISLPNSNVFPTYTLQDIEVGTGDGTTNEFECPIPWFLKDTDKLYKNGQLLTRGVDYTIDHKHNRQKLISISEGNFAKIIQSAVEYMGEAGKKSSKNITWGSYIIPFTACLYSIGGYNSQYVFGLNPYIVFKASEPLILDMEKETEINYFVSPYIKGGSKLKLYYSNDNEEYTYVGEVDVLTSQINGGTAIPDKHKLSFNTIRARYWKVEITSANGQDAVYELPYSYNTTYDHTVEETKTAMYNQCGFLGYVGEPIKFKTPPAKGDIITMDVSLDRPYKTTQNVIDIAFKYTY